MLPMTLLRQSGASRYWMALLAILSLSFCFGVEAWAHNVAEGDKGYNYDTHADAPGIDYHGYDKGQNSVGERGQLVAPFDGKHGWFWRNRGDAPVTVTLRTEGAYTEIKRVV